MAQTAVGDAAETIEKNFASFMECVNVTLGNDNFIPNLDTIAAKGRHLIRQIETISIHAADLKRRWDANNA
ncbi:MAG: hypothetical protein ACYS7Y_04140 [Planctomycetota bacterium]|jgi:hypothetical protein